MRYCRFLLRWSVLLLTAIVLVGWSGGVPIALADSNQFVAWCNGPETGVHCIAGYATYDSPDKKNFIFYTDDEVETNSVDTAPRIKEAAKIRQDKFEEKTDYEVKSIVNPKCKEYSGKKLLNYERDSWLCLW